MLPGYAASSNSSRAETVLSTFSFALAADTAAEQAARKAAFEDWVARECYPFLFANARLGEGVRFSFSGTHIEEAEVTAALVQQLAKSSNSRPWVSGAHDKPEP